MLPGVRPKHNATPRIGVWRQLRGKPTLTNASPTPDLAAETKRGVDLRRPTGPRIGVRGRGLTSGGLLRILRYAICVRRIHAPEGPATQSPQSLRIRPGAGRRRAG